MSKINHKCSICGHNILKGPRGNTILKGPRGNTKTKTGNHMWYSIRGICVFCDVCDRYFEDNDKLNDLEW